MAVLSFKQVLEDKQTCDPNAVTALVLTHKALSDVSCLGEFKNLERLDLSFNNLTSLEGLKSCVNLKWLSVVQNKLQNLKGIEGLTKLTVLNAGKNKLKSMDDVRSLVSLRALILNDNEIGSICKLDQMKELNTLVLSRNPILKIDESLVKMKAITKLSLSNCHLQTVDTLKSCTELKELRLAHNDIKTLPSQLAHNLKLQLLDVGNNVITSMSDLKVLSSLISLRNLNLQGNPIAENDKLAKKIRKLVPNLQIFNGRSIDKSRKNESDTVEKSDDFSLGVAKKQGPQIKEKMYPSVLNNNSRHSVLRPSNDDQHQTARDVGAEKGLKGKNQKMIVPPEEKDLDIRENSPITERKSKKKLKKVQQDEVDVNHDKEMPFTDPSVKKELERKKDKRQRVLQVEDAYKEDGTIIEKGLKGKSKRLKENIVNLIDDGETPFTDLFADAGENAENSGAWSGERAVLDVNMNSGLVTFPMKRKSIKNRGKGALALLSPAAEVGLGGPSAWDDE